MSLQMTSTVVIVSSALLMILLEKLFPYTKGQKIIRYDFFNDFFWYTIVQSYVLGLLIFGFLNYIYANTSFSQYRLIASYPVWAQVAFFVITHDIYIYWFHRWMHNNKYLWRIHEAHHTVKDCDWLAGSRSHSIEILINQTVEFAPIILLGAAPEVAIYKGMISAIWGMFIHCNINVRLGWIQYFINGPEMHRWHHSDDEGKEYQNNYATKLAIWDWIFGTAFYPDPRQQKPKRYGLSDTPDYPLEYVKKLDSEKEKLKGSGIITSGIIYLLKRFYLNTYEYIMHHIYAFRSFKSTDRVT